MAEESRGKIECESYDLEPMTGAKKALVCCESLPDAKATHDRIR